MKLNVKEYFKLSIIYSMVAAVAPALQVIIQPIIEGDDRLTPTDFSHLAISESVSAVVFIVVSFSMGSAISRFYYDKKDKEGDLKVLISTCLTGVLMRGVLLIGLSLVLGNIVGMLFSQPELQDFASYGPAAVIIGITRSINNVVTSLYRNEKKVYKFVLVSLGFALFRTAGGVVALFMYDMSFIGYVYGNCIGGGIISVIVIAYTYWKSGVHYDRKLAVPMMRFGLPIMQFGIVNWGLLFADRWFLESTPVDLGVYDTALKFVLGVEMILTGIYGANQPEIFSMMHDGVKKNMEQIKKASNIYMLQTELIMVAAIFPVMLYLDIAYSTELSLAATFIGVLFVRFLLRTQYLIFALPVYFAKKTGVFFIINSVSLVVNVAMNYFLIPLLGIYGAIAATLVANLILVILVYQYQKRVMQIDWNMNKVLYFPIFIILGAGGLEIAKVMLGWNMYLVAGVLEVYAIIVIAYLYKAELKSLYGRYVKKAG